MKTKTIILSLLSTAIILSCTTQPKIYPHGMWHSTMNRPDITFVQNADTLIAIVHHKIHNGGTCPISYPVMETNHGYYIQAEGRILIHYDANKDELFLSPGGEYKRLE
ncbi:MAG: DUF3876 domain-containing protein [Prevotellaceae bacterium]|nr:DUF3876 domain-containing protein [Candidatus Minthosoma equi]